MPRLRYNFPQRTGMYVPLIAAPNLATQKLGKQNQNLMCQGGKTQRQLHFDASYWKKTELAKVIEAILFSARCTLGGGKYKLFPALLLIQPGYLVFL